jgi:putative acetyltransferase
MRSGMADAHTVPDDLVLRRYASADLEPAVALWQRAWDAAMPEIDFGERLAWWRARWTGDLVPNNAIAVAEHGGRLVGFVVIDPRSGWLDQIVVDPPFWRSGIGERLIEEAKRLAPAGIRLDVNQSNARAVRFYERLGFRRAGAGSNPNSGAATWIYEWRPGA